jgi:hypothetical protein
LKNNIIDKYCECGCGGIIKPNRRFLLGHANKGKPMSEEQKKQIGCANKGKIRSEETIEKMRQISLGRKHSEETKRKISEISKTHKLSDEHKQKLFAGRDKFLKENPTFFIEINTGRSHSEETKAKIGAKSKGRHHSEESLIKRFTTMVEKRQFYISENDDIYCDMWLDREYIADLRGVACEHCGITNMMNLHMFGFSLNTHHKYGKKKCAPDDIQTLCNSCHIKWHVKLRRIIKLWGKLSPECKNL